MMQRAPAHFFFFHGVWQLLACVCAVHAALFAAPVQTLKVCYVNCLSMQVPVGVAVENPDGGMAYGAPGSPARATTYVPPSSPNAMTGHIEGRSQA